MRALIRRRIGRGLEPPYFRRLLAERHGEPFQLVASSHEHGDAIARLVLLEARGKLIRPYTEIVNRDDFIIDVDPRLDRRRAAAYLRDNEAALVDARRDAERGLGGRVRGLEAQTVPPKRFAVVEILS